MKQFLRGFELTKNRFMFIFIIIPIWILTIVMVLESSKRCLDTLGCRGFLRSDLNESFFIALATLLVAALPTIFVLFLSQAAFKRWKDFSIVAVPVISAMVGIMMYADAVS